MQLYKRKGYWWVAAKFWDAATGQRKRVQRSTGVRDDGSAGAKRTASIVAEDIARSVAIGQNRKARPETVKEAFAASLKAKRRANKSEATIEITLEKAKHVLDFFPPDMPLRELTDAHLERYADHALQIRKPATVQRELLELRAGMRVLGVPVPKMPELGRVNIPRERWLTAEETRKLLFHVSEKRRDHVLIYRLLGLRKSELFRIECQDVDVARRSVRVRGTKTEGADRRLPLVGDALEILEARCKLYPTGPLFEAWGSGNSDRELRRASNAAGLGDLSFNDLRRSFATELALKGVPSLHLAHLMGHKSTRMVEQIYARVSAGVHLHNAVTQLESYGRTSSMPPAPVEDTHHGSAAHAAAPDFDEEAVTLRAPRIQSVTAASPDKGRSVDTTDAGGDMEDPYVY